ncbi:MAG: transcriptional regulator [Cytophagales bacterium]|nr:transcriptional regulator [Cytophagales bacterium]
MRILKTFFVAVLINPCFDAWSFQSQNDSWYLGKIKLKDSTTLSGRINYQLKYNVLMHKSQGQTKTYTANIVDYFEVQDKDFKKVKRYHSIPVKIRENKVIPEFFEVIIRGNMTLLKREVQVRKRMGKRTVVSTVDRFYYMDRSGFVQNLVPTKKNILKLMEDHAREVNEFMEDLDLNPSKSAHLKQLFIFYNSLSQSSG